MHFGAPWGRLLKVASGSVVLLLAAVATFGGMNITGVAPGPRLLLILMPFLALAAALPFVIRGYSLQGGELIVHRLAWDARFSLHGLKEAAFVPGAAARSIRLFGNGGLFVFAGLYWNKNLGRFRMLATDLNRTVVLKLPDRTLVISPEDPEEFVAALRGEVTHR